MQTIICPCGQEFKEFLSRIGRAKYCSKKCLYKYRIRPSGLEYVLKKENPTSFKKGHRTWNAGTKGLMPKPWNYKGDDIKYGTLHDWVGHWLGKATVCTFCGKTEGRIEWANKSRKYKRDLKDWISLCKKCHYKYDH